jgi:hypothetical protein
MPMRHWGASNDEQAAREHTQHHDSLILNLRCSSEIMVGARRIARKERVKFVRDTIGLAAYVVQLASRAPELF